MKLIFICLFLHICSGATFEATTVYGQSSFTENSQIGPTSASTINSPAGSDFGPGGNFYSVDSSHNRVLRYPAGSTVADRVYGQSGSFSTNSRNKLGINANGLNGPLDVAVDSTERVYIVDTQNNRVLSYPPGSTVADRVYGQGGSFTTNDPNKGGLSADSLFQPRGVAVDSLDNVYISDSVNRRILYYIGALTSPTRVYGQGGSFTTGSGSPASSSTIGNPNYLYLDDADNLFVSDGLYHRVLMFPKDLTTATRVYGQGGSFTTGVVNNGGVSANSLSSPNGISCSGSGTSLILTVVDSQNYRALLFLGENTQAQGLFGQPDFSSTGPNNPVLGASSLKTPSGVGSLRQSATQISIIIGDNGNRRMLGYTYDESVITTAPSGGNTGNNVCFHHSTIIQPFQGSYGSGTLQSFLEDKREHPDCVVVHQVQSQGVIIYFENKDLKDPSLKMKPLRLTHNHLVLTLVGPSDYNHFHHAEDLNAGDRVRCVYTHNNICTVHHVEFTSKYETYFGLNCLKSVVYADGYTTSTFGNYHSIPSLWMGVVGKIFGVRYASTLGDSIVNWAYRNYIL